ncbi:MAG: hypothetical protein ACF8OB_19365 [Phycisphaeraceae bacterium JB051]
MGRMIALEIMGLFTATQNAQGRRFERGRDHVRHSCGRMFRRPDRGNALHILSVLVICGLLSCTTLHASENNQPQASIIAPQLLTEVDALLATDSAVSPSKVTQGMGPLVLQVQAGDWPDRQIHAYPVSETQLNVTAIPLPNAFGMALLLLTLMLLAYLIRRYRASVS